MFSGPSLYATPYNCLLDWNPFFLIFILFYCLLDRFFNFNCLIDYFSLQLPIRRNSVYLFNFVTFGPIIFGWNIGWTSMTSEYEASFRCSAVSAHLAFKASKAATQPSTKSCLPAKIIWSKKILYESVPGFFWVDQVRQNFVHISEFLRRNVAKNG